MKRFLSVVILFVSVFAIQAQTDSLRLEMEGDKAFVIHKVEAKQTLFSLAKRYQTSIDAIMAENPTLASGLQVGQTLKIPYGGEVSTTPDETATALEVQYITHQVKAGETLFSISKDYEVSVPDIKEWNGLQTNSISLDQTLKIQVPKGTEGTESVPVDASVAIVTVDTPATELSASRDTATYEGTPFQQFVVEGIAEVIVEEEPSSKFFALHRTAKEGTVIKVRNLMNDLTVYVRVIGSIPETSTNEDVIIKLNQRAYENLKAIDKRFRVELSYFQ